jgi:hypothetical protein
MNGRDRMEIAREEMVWRGRIREALSHGPQTVPALARALGKPASEVMYWMMSLRKYGQILESEEADAEGFYEYRWVGKES